MVTFRKILDVQRKMRYDLRYVYKIFHAYKICIIVSFYILLFYSIASCITKPCLYNFDPLKPHFYIAKLGFAGVCIIFLISAQNIDCGYSLEPPHRGGSNEYPQSIFEQIFEKYPNFLSENFHFFVVIFSVFE